MATTTILVLLIALMLAVIIAGVIVSQVTLFSRAAKTRDLATCAYEKAKYFSNDVSRLNEKFSFVASKLDELREQQNAIPAKPPDEDSEQSARDKEIEKQFERMQSFQPVNYGLDFGGADENNV